MEKKKLLLVAISVGVFLVLTIGAAIVAFTPKTAAVAPSAVASIPAPQIGIPVTPAPLYQGPPAGMMPEINGTFETAPLDAVDMLRGPTDVPGLQTPPERTVRQGDDFFITGQPGRAPETLISVPKPSTAAVPDTAPSGRATPQAARQSAPQPTRQSAPQTTRQPAPAAARQTRVYHDYWVQTGAFSTVATAEGVKETLASKGITSIIDNRIIDGRTLFRVRVGPYTSNNEANYWLALIKSIDGFENSQVRQTQR